MLEESDDDEVEFLEERNEGGTSSSLPHLRSNCATHKFVSPHQINICENCYCYVCDIRAADCKFWSKHCQATNEGTQKDHWKKYKDGELERMRVAAGAPKKKAKTILSFFKKSDSILEMVDKTGAMLGLVENILTRTEDMLERVDRIESSVKEISDALNTRAGSSSSSLHQRDPATVVEERVGEIAPSTLPPVDCSRHLPDEEYSWAVIEGPRCNSTGSTLINHGPETPTGPNRFVHCTICLNFRKGHGWATPKYRRWHKFDLKRHTESSSHILAVASPPK